MNDYCFTKAHHLIAYIISKSKEPGNIELMKLTYLIDVEYYRLFGKSLSSLNYRRGKLGPYSYDFPRVNSELENSGITKITLMASRRGSSIAKRAHRFIEPKFRPELSPEEKEVVNKVLKRFRSLSPKKLEEESYRTEPMQEILKDEKKLGKELIGTPLNFSSIKRDGFMERWLKNKEDFSKDSLGLEYEEFLIKEKLAFANWVNG